MRKRWMFAGLVALCLGAALPAAAQVQPFDGGWTRLVNAQWSERTGTTGGQCLDVPYETKAVGTVLQLWPCHGGDNQFFRKKDNELDARIAVYEGKHERCLGYEPAGGKVNITACNLAPRWRTTLAGAIATTDLQYCVTVTDDGRPTLAACTAAAPTARQAFGSNWHMATLGAPYGNVLGLVNGQYGNECLDVKRESTAPGASMDHYPCHLRRNQRIQVRGSASALYLVVYDNRQVLCIANVFQRDWDPSTQAVPCNRNDKRQQWQRSGNTFVNLGTGRCLDANAPSRGAVGTWPCHRRSNQDWGLIR